MITEYRLSPAALRDLDAIWAYTADRWSIAQAETYIRQLTSGMNLLVQNPELAPENRQISPPVRLYRSGSHLIVYRIAVDWIEVLRIAHARQNWLALLGL